MKSFLAFLFLISAFSVTAGVRNPTLEEQGQIAQAIFRADLKEVKNWFKKEKINPLFVSFGESFLGTAVTRPVVRNEDFPWDTYWTKEQKEVAEYILKIMKGKVDYPRTAENGGTSPIISAAAECNTDAMRWLVTKGARADICEKTPFGGLDCRIGGACNEVHEIYFSMKNVRPDWGLCTDFWKAYGDYDPSLHATYEEDREWLISMGIKPDAHQEFEFYMAGFKKMGLNTLPEIREHCDQRYRDWNGGINSK